MILKKFNNVILVHMIFAWVKILKEMAKFKGIDHICKTTLFFFKLFTNMVATLYRWRGWLTPNIDALNAREPQSVRLNAQ